MVSMESKSKWQCPKCGADLPSWRIEMIIRTKAIKDYYSPTQIQQVAS